MVAAQSCSEEWVICVALAGLLQHSPQLFLHISRSFWGLSNCVTLSTAALQTFKVLLNERSATLPLALLYFPSTCICPPFPTCS